MHSYRLIYMECRRLRYFVGSVLTFQLFVIGCLYLGYSVYLEAASNNALLVLLPFLALGVSQIYEEFISGQLLQEWLRSHEGSKICRLCLCMLSITVSLPLGAVFAFISKSLIAGAVFWMVIDILAVLLHCLNLMTKQATGLVMRYLLTIPLGVPLFIISLIALNQQHYMPAIKLLLGVRLLVIYFGGTMVLASYQIGGQGLA